MTAPNYRRGTAALAAAREAAIAKACDLADPLALERAMREHQAWLQRLLGCTEAEIRPYISWRLHTIGQAGLLPERLHHIDAEECVYRIIVKGESAHAT